MGWTAFPESQRLHGDTTRSSQELAQVTTLPANARNGPAIFVIE